MDIDKTILNILEEYGVFVTEQSKKILLRNNKKASGNLINSLQVKAVMTNKGPQMTIVAPPYAKFVDLGVQGKKSNKKAPKSPFKYKTKIPPAGKIDRWIVQKNIKGSRNKKGQFITRKSLQFAIRYSIFYYGIAPTNFTKPIFNNLKFLEKRIAEEVSKDIAKEVVGYLDNLKFSL